MSVKLEMSTADADRLAELLWDERHRLDRSLLTLAWWLQPDSENERERILLNAARAPEGAELAWSDEAWARGPAPTPAHNRPDAGR